MINKGKLIETLEQRKNDFNYTNNFNLAERLVFEYTLQEIIDEIKQGKYETACSSCFEIYQDDELV